MNAKLFGLVVGAGVALSACRTEVSKLSCGADTECGAGFYCDKDRGGGRGVCVTKQEKETRCADGNDNDLDTLVDCADPDCQAAACRPAVGPCDEAEFCVAGKAECPADGFQKDTVCREESACGPKGICSGTSAACPGEAAKDSAGKTCRVETACGKAAVCDGLKPACPPFEPKDKGTVCGEVPPGPCVEGGVCDGASDVCPTVTLLTASDPCPGLEPCEAVRYCSGNSGACSSDVPAPKGVGEVCREAAGDCDVAETCDGSSLECPDDLKKAALAKCYVAPDGSCEKDAFCDGANVDCPPVELQGADFVCRPAAGLCDVEEKCTGTDAACPEDVLVAADVATPCGDSKGECDPAEFCDGLHAECPTDVLYGSDHSCRPSAGKCDPEDFCDGVNAACADKRLPGGTLCAEAGGSCAESSYCVEGDPVCPEVKLKDQGFVCKPGGGCTYDALCTGASAVCPANGSKPAGTFCGATPADPCIVPQSCDAAGKCLPQTYLAANEQCGLTSLERCASGTSANTTTCPWPTTNLSNESGWTWENPLPQGNNLYGVASTAVARFFVGDAGTVLRYDGSFSKLKVVAGSESQAFRGALRGICIEPVSNVIYVVGDQGYIGKHNPLDLGGTFSQVSSNSLFNVTFRAVWCEGGGKILAVGNSGNVGVVYHGDGATMIAEQIPATGALAAVWASSWTDVWAVGSQGAVLHRDSTGAWTLTKCPEADLLQLNGVSSVAVTVGGNPADVFISGRTTDYTKPLPGVYRVKRADLSRCEAYPDPDQHPPEGLTGISMTGTDSGWAINGAGEALELRSGAWGEPVPVGIARELYAVDAGPLGGVAVGGQAGAISIRSSVGVGKWRWLPSRAATWFQLNAAWSGQSNGGEESVAVGKHGVFLRRSPQGQWAVPPVLAASFRDDLYAVSEAGDEAALYVGGWDPATLEGVVHKLDATGFVKRWPVTGATVTSVGANETHVTAAAKQPYQLMVSGGTGFSLQASETATAVWSAASGAQAYFAGQKVYSLNGTGGGAAGATPLTAFPDGTYVALRGLTDSGTGALGLYGAVAEKKAYYLLNANGSTSVMATEVPLNSAPMALGVVSAGKFWVVGERGMTKLVGATTDPGDWAGTNWTLRGVAVTPSGDVEVVGDQGAILRRLHAATD